MTNLSHASSPAGAVAGLKAAVLATIPHTDIAVTAPHIESGSS